MSIHGLWNILSPLLKPTAQKKNSFKILLLIDNAPGHPRALMEMYMRFMLFSCLLKQHPFCSPCIQGVISTFKSYYLGNTFYKAVAAIDSGSSNGSGQSKLKTFWKGFTILDAIKNICDSWEEVKILTKHDP